MSISALLIAVRNTLRENMGVVSDECRVMPDAKPPPVAGDKFFSVHALDWTIGDPDLNLGIDENYGIAVTASYRTAFIPYDDQGEEAYIKAIQSIENDCRNIIRLLHQSYDVMGMANNLIITQSFKIFEPLRFQSCDPTPSFVTGEWFGGEKGQVYSGLVQQVNFSGARRKQRTTEMEL